MWKLFDTYFEEIIAGVKSESFYRIAALPGMDCPPPLWLTFEILTDKFEEATFFFSSRYIAFLWPLQLFSHPVAETSQSEVMEI